MTEEDLRIQVVMASMDERRLVEDLAEKDHRTASNFCRNIILKEVNKLLKKED